MTNIAHPVIFTEKVPGVSIELKNKNNYPNHLKAKHLDYSCDHEDYKLVLLVRKQLLNQITS